MDRIPVFISGVGQTGPVVEDPRSIPEMVLDAVQGALDDAGVGFDAVDAVVTASVDLFDGLTASNIAVTEVVGAVMKPETRISADGLAAVVHGACQIWSEAYRTVLVVAHGKASMSDYQSLTKWALDPIYLQPLGLDFLACAGLQAKAVATKQEDGEAEVRWARIAAVRRSSTNGRGLLPVCSAADVLGSPIVASPLRQEMCAPLGDAACAVLLSGSPTFSPRVPPIVLRGVGHDLSAHVFLDDRLSSWPGLARASRRAYTIAGIDDPKSAFSLAEPSCLYPHEEEIFLEATGIGDDILLSPEGGLFAGAAPVAAGLSRLIAATQRMRQSSQCGRAFVHGTWGPAGQGQAVTILENAA